MAGFAGSGVIGAAAGAGLSVAFPVRTCSIQLANAYVSAAAAAAISRLVKSGCLGATSNLPSSMGKATSIAQSAAVDAPRRATRRRLARRAQIIAPIGAYMAALASRLAMAAGSEL
jgi:hypothetical protein